MTDPTLDDQSLSYRWGIVFVSLILFLCIVLAPSPAGLNAEGQRLAGVVALMAILWCTQSIPLAVTSLIPLVAFPFLGIQSAGEVSKSYMNSTILLYVSGFAIAIGVERWGLHRRLALWVLSILGTGPKRVVLGFMLGTALMSMWISNTASALLMLPIALAVLASLNVQGDDQHKQAIMTKRFAVALLLGIAYSSSIGGMSTLIGTPTNGVYAGYWSSTGATAEELQRYSVSLGQWFLMFFPMSVLMFIGVWFVLCLPIWRGLTFGHAARNEIRDQYLGLGRMSVGEFRMMIVFMLIACLWMTRVSLNVGGFTLVGWEDGLSALLDFYVPGFNYKGLLHDSTAGLLMMIVMFLVPVRDEETETNQYLMNWELLEHKLPWGILLLFGGGFAIADACSSTGLSSWLGEMLGQKMSTMSSTLQVASVTTLVIFLTEFTSNTATISTLLPILEKTALALSLDPRFLMLPATIAASCAFMLPIATPPNAIVFSSNKLTVWDMMKTGFLLNLLGILVVTGMTMLWVVRVVQVS